MMVHQNTDSATPPLTTPSVISLAVLFDALVGRWKIIIGAMILSLFVGLGVVVNRPTVYEYSTTIEIGGPAGGDGVRPVIEPAKLAGMLNVGHIIRSVEFSARFPISLSINVEATALGSSPLIRLVVKGKPDDNEQIVEFLREITKLIIQECEQLIEQGPRQDLLTKKLSLTQQIEHVRQRVSQREKELMRIGELGRLYQTQLAEAKATIAATLNERSSAITGTEASLRSLAFLIKGNELQNAQDNYHRLDELLNDKLPRQREDLNTSIAQSQLEIATLESELYKTQNQLTTLRKTRVQILPSRSAHPMASDGARIFGITFLAGGLLGLLGAFIAELAASMKVRRPT